MAGRPNLAVDSERASHSTLLYLSEKMKIYKNSYTDSVEDYFYHIFSKTQDTEAFAGPVGDPNTLLFRAAGAAKSCIYGLV
jgi:hypothetical protein